MSDPPVTIDHTPLVCAQSWCAHEETRIVIERPGSVHFAREVCQNCDRVLRWLPKPSTLEARQFNALRIARLSMNESLRDWERKFVKSIAQQRKLSPKQMAVLDKLAATYLGGSTR
jgi:hypothetical protein